MNIVNALDGEPNLHPHRVLNESDRVLRCLVVKTPRPIKGTRLL